MLTPAEAEKLILDNMMAFHREDCPLVAAHRRALRVEIRADRDLPPFDRVTMDGYALRSTSLAAGLRAYRVTGVQAAGMRAFKLAADTDACIEVMTGAVLPDGADCVVPYEEVTREGITITLSEAAMKFASGNAVHRRGTDRRAGDTIVRAGVRLGAREIAVAAACGYGSVTVAQQPRIAVLTTGDELVEVDAPVAAHQVRRSNDYALRAALLAAGFSNVSRFYVRDVREDIEHLLWHILAEYDVVVICGGISKGKFDLLPAELERQGVRKLFHGVAQRPGKPMWFGLSQRGSPVFALPGNPVSAYTCLHRYVLPALGQASGLTPAPLRTIALMERFVFKPRLACFLPVRLAHGPRAEQLALPDPTNTSGDFAGLLGTEGFVVLPAEQDEFPAGTLLQFWPWA